MIQGNYKTCPRCKGHGYILGQKDKKYFTLPNYKHNQKGICFLCDGKKQAFFTEDNRVLKFKDKYGRRIITEYSPLTGDYIGIVSDLNTYTSYTTSNTLDFSNPIVPTDLDLTSLNMEDLLFPTMYEAVLNDSCPIIDLILATYPESKAININYFKTLDFDNNDFSNFDFLIYYDKDYNIIKPFYTKPRYEKHDSLLTGIAIVPESYSFAVSGSYDENNDKLLIGIKNNKGFKYLHINNFKEEYTKYTINHGIKHSDIYKVFLHENNLLVLAIKVIKDLKKIVDIDIF